MQGMREFFEYHVKCYEHYQNLPVHFVGSVAFHFQEEMLMVAKEYGVNIGRIVKEPIMSLLDYHKKVQFQQEIAS